MPCIEIKNLNFTYSKKTPYEKRALKDINLTVDEGEFVGLVGATGSGKSTLIQHLNGLIKVQNKKQSSVAVNGMSATDKKTLKKLRFEVYFSIPNISCLKARFIGIFPSVRAIWGFPRRKSKNTFCTRRNLSA